MPQTLIQENCGTTVGGIAVMKSLSYGKQVGIAFGDQAAVKTARSALDAMIESGEYLDISK